MDLKQEVTNFYTQVQYHAARQTQISDMALSVFRFGFCSSI